MTSHPRRGREEGKPNPGNKPHAGSRMPPWAPAPPSGRAPHLVPFTPLRAPPSDILAYAEECHLVRTPDPRPDPSGADMSKYCKYHRCHGHNTNDCQAWRKEIKRLIQAGKLGNFIDWDWMAKRDTRGRGETPQMPQTGKEKDRDEPNRQLEILENYPYGAAEPAADPEKPDPDVKWRLVDGSTLPTAPEPPAGFDGKATDDVPPALSVLIRNPSAGVVVEVGMAGAGGRRRGRYSGNFHPAMLKEDQKCSGEGVPSSNIHQRVSWGSYSIDGDLGGPEGRSTLAGLSRAITGGVAREGEKRTPDSTPSKVGSAITPIEDSSSSDCDEACDEPVFVRGELTRCDVVTREKRKCQRMGWKLLRPWVENGSEVWEEDGGLVVRERVSIIVGMVCIGVKGERVIPKVPKPVLGGEIPMGSLGVRERGGMSCGGEARRDRGEAADGGAAWAGKEALSFGCIAIWPCGCGRTTRAADRGGRVREGCGLV
nr:uncharacterized protein LOC109171091 [Ipomoea batatas]